MAKTDRFPLKPVGFLFIKCLYKTYLRMGETDFAVDKGFRVCYNAFEYEIVRQAQRASFYKTG